MIQKEKMSAEEITFGVELETGIPDARRDFLIGGYHNGKLLTNAPKFEGQYWKAERDGSLNFSLSRGCEFVSPVLHGAAGVDNLLKMVQWIKARDGRVNQSCGLHIHIGWKSVLGENITHKDLSCYIAKLAAVVNINAFALYAQTGKRRDQSRYCKELTLSHKEFLRNVRQSGSIQNYAGLDRYCLLNVKPILSKGTFEFRVFAGTLDEDLILHHLWCCLFIARFAQNLQTVPWETKGWASEEGGRGSKALKGFYHKIKHHCLVGEMNTRYNAMKNAALLKAEAFDRKYSTGGAV